jgi:mRNA-degrading endonuclease RelE of RelBE toxin-antitoxin system
MAVEVTGGGRIWYLVDEETRTVWVVQASTKHPKRTGG